MSWHLELLCVAPYLCTSPGGKEGKIFAWVCKTLGPRPNEDRKILALIPVHANAGSLCPVDQDDQTRGCNELKEETSLLTPLIQEIFIYVVKKLHIFIMV